MILFDFSHFLSNILFLIVFLYFANQVSLYEDSYLKISKHIGVDVFISKSRISSQRRCSIKIGVPKNFAKLTGSHLCQSLFFDKVSFFTSFTELFLTTDENADQTNCLVRRYIRLFEHVDCHYSQDFDKGDQNLQSLVSEYCLHSLPC